MSTESIMKHFVVSGKVARKLLHALKHNKTITYVKERDIYAESKEGCKLLKKKLNKLPDIDTMSKAYVEYLKRTILK